MAEQDHQPKIFHPDKIQPAPNRLYFFDANVWLEIFRPILSRREHMRPYTLLWQRLREAGQPCVVANAVLVSEIVNRILRLRFDVWRTAPNREAELRAAGILVGKDKIDYKKHFRGTSEYSDALNQFLASWDEVAYFIVYQELEVDSKIVPAILQRYGKSSDFNDKYYMHFCKEQGLWLVSNDADFYVSGLNVVTTNRDLLEQYEEMLRKQR